MASSNADTGGRYRLALWLAQKFGRCLTDRCTCPCHIPPPWSKP